MTKHRDKSTSRGVRRRGQGKVQPSPYLRISFFSVFYYVLYKYGQHFVAHLIYMSNLLFVGCHTGNENIEEEIILFGVIRDSLMKEMPFEHEGFPVFQQRRILDGEISVS